MALSETQTFQSSTVKVQSPQAAAARKSVFAHLLHLHEELLKNPNDAEVMFLDFCAKNHASSKAQLFQDLFAAFMTGGKRDGFFVEFGATNGVSLSNTWLLETQLGWTGILAEPARCWHEALHQNRKARIDLRYVGATTGEKLEFTETTVPELSTVSTYMSHDFNPREVKATYEVESISLNDLLALHQAPRLIDYMSLDTEGSEYGILRNFDFSRWSVQVMTVEHNMVEPARSNIKSLLEQHGFIRIFDALSHWDDWYVQRRLIGLA